MGLDGKPFCICSGMCEAGDMAPRLWICEVHGRSNMIGVSFLIDEIVVRFNLSKDEAWDKINNLRLRQIELYRLRGDIYFDDEELYPDVQRLILGGKRSKDEYMGYKVGAFGL